MRFPIQLMSVAVTLLIVGCAENSTDDNLAGSPVEIDTRQYEETIYQVKVTDDIEYGRGTTESGEIPLLLDLYEPVEDDNSSRPALLIIHGGSFLRGTRKQEELAMFANQFASRGYLVASMDYRLSGDDPELNSTTQQLLDASPAALRKAYRGAGINDKSPWAAFEDAQAALRWLHDSAGTLGVDSSRIAVLGASAGALTALKLAYRLDEVAPQVAAPGAVTSIWGSFEDADTSVLEAGEPPLLIIHGTDDKVVNFNSSLVLYKRAQEVGVPVEFVPLQGRGHALTKNDFFTMRVDSGVTVFDKIFAFTDAALLQPDKLPLVNCDSFGDACP